MDDLRICLDTEEDHKLISEIYNSLYKTKPIKLKDIIEFLEKNPELRELNSGIEQKAVKGKIF